MYGRLSSEDRGPSASGAPHVAFSEVKVDARHGVKGLFAASESYFLDRSNSDEPLRATCCALAHPFQLQLHCHPATLYHLDSAALASCTALIADRDSAATTIERMAV